MDVPQEHEVKERVIGVRLPDSTHDAIAQELARQRAALRAISPAATLTRSDVVRGLILAGLAAAGVVAPVTGDPTAAKAGAEQLYRDTMGGPGAAGGGSR